MRTEGLDLSADLMKERHREDCWGVNYFLLINVSESLGSFSASEISSFRGSVLACFLLDVAQVNFCSPRIRERKDHSSS